MARDHRRLRVFSAAEVGFLIALASELGYFSKDASGHLQRDCDNLIPQMESLVQKLELLTRSERNIESGGKPRA